MMKIWLGLIIVVISLALMPMAQAEEKLSDYPVIFTVQSASVYEGQSGGCFMWITDGKWSYYVENSGVVHCHTWSVGTVLHGKFSKSGFSWYPQVDLLDYDEQRKLHKYRCNIMQKHQ